MSTAYDEVPPFAADPDEYLAARERFPVLSRDDLDTLPKPVPLIDGLLPAKGLAMLAGQRGLGKTLLTLDVAACVATDEPLWIGREVTTHGPVLYVSQEGFHGIPNRVRAWEAVHHRRTDRIGWMREPIDLKRPRDQYDLATVVRATGAVLVVVDSARATGAGKEDTGDMGEYVFGLEALKAATDALVLVLHNSGWNGSRERGSTLLGDACDTILMLQGDPEGLRTLEHTKFRDGDGLTPPLGFTFRPVDGTHSGVLVPTDVIARQDTRRDRVLAHVRTHPGQSTTAVANGLGLHRPHVSEDLQALARTDQVRNEGTATRPQWTAPGEEPLT